MPTGNPQRDGEWALPVSYTHLCVCHGCWLSTIDGTPCVRPGSQGVSFTIKYNKQIYYEVNEQL